MVSERQARRAGVVGRVNGSNVSRLGPGVSSLVTSRKYGCVNVSRSRQRAVNPALDVLSR